MHIGLLLGSIIRLANFMICPYSVSLTNTIQAKD